MEHANDFTVILSLVPELIGRPQGAGVGGLKSHEEALAPASGKDIQEFQVLYHIERGAADPPPVQFGKLCEKLFRAVVVPDEVGIKEKHGFAFQTLDFFNYLAYRSYQVVMMKPMANAEVAGVRAPAAHLHRAPSQVIPPLDARTIWGDDQGGIERFQVPIDARHPAPGKIVQQPRPRSLRVPENEGIGMERRLLGQESRVDAAHDDRYILGSKSVRDFVGTRGGPCDGGDPHEIG